MKPLLLVVGLVFLLSASAHGFMNFWDFMNQAGFLPPSPPPGNSDTTCVCGTSNTRRIVNGEVMENNEFPFMLAMVHSSSGSHFCGASLLTQNMALTAAHCTHGKNIPISVIAGTNDVRSRSGTTQISRVANIIEHEQYRQTNNGVWNDIAILVLATPLRLNSVVVPVCMPSGRLSLENEVAKVIGWGKTGRNLPPSPILLGIDVRMYTARECQSRFPTFAPSTMTCSGSPTATACMGDSGGPIIWTDPETNRFTLVGLVSYGLPGCIPGLPTVQTDVSAFIPWIRARVPGLCQRS